MRINADFKEVAVPNAIKAYLSFDGRFAYILDPIASDRKEIIAKQMALDFYNQTSEWFDQIYNAIKKSLKAKNKVSLIETYYDQKLDDIIWDFKTLPIESLKDQEVSFEFDTIYNCTL